MKRIFPALLLLLCSALCLQAQNSTTTTFAVKVVAPPTCTVTVIPTPTSLTGLTLYSGQSNTINFNISACAIASSSATATWDGVSITPLFTAATTGAPPVPAALSVTISAAQSTLGNNHALVLTIPWPVLAMNNQVTIPNASKGVAYSQDLAALTSLTMNGQPCTTCTFSCSSPCSLPAGLSLSSGGLITGIPSSSTGSWVGFSFMVSAT